MQYTTKTTPTFEQFYVQYLPLVRHILSRVRGYQGDLDDLIQETMLKAWKAYDRLDHQQNVPSWISQIARNVARDFLRYVQGHTRLNCSLEIETNEGRLLNLPDPAQSTQTIPLEEREAVRAAYQRLQPDDQRVMALLLQEETPKEIAEALHLDIDTCRVRVQRARRRFQRAYQEG